VTSFAMPENVYLKRLLSSIALNDDKTAYKELFVSLHYQLKRFAFSILKSNEEAEELVSDIFIRIWERRHQLTEIESPIQYFYVTTKNLALTRINRQKKLVRFASDDWLVQLESIYFDPEKLMITEETFRQVRQAISELPPRCRIIFKLVKEDGLKYSEVAELLNLSVKTIETQMAIAFRRVGKSLRFEIKSASHSASAKKS